MGAGATHLTATAGAAHLAAGATATGTGTGTGRHVRFATPLATPLAAPLAAPTLRERFLADAARVPPPPGNGRRRSSSSGAGPSGDSDAGRGDVSGVEAAGRVLRRVGGLSLTRQQTEALGTIYSSTSDFSESESPAADGTSQTEGGDGTETETEGGSSVR